MDFALTYLVERLFYRVFEFLRHWYVSGSRYLIHSFLSFLEGLDRTIALRITLRHFFEPLYKDYTILGHILGIIFRTGRVIIGSVIYVALLALFLIFFLFYLAALPLLIFNVFKNF